MIWLTSEESVMPIECNFSETKKPIIQRRLDYWLISDLLQDDEAKVGIVTAINIGPHCVLVCV